MNCKSMCYAAITALLAWGVAFPSQGQGTEEAGLARRKGMDHVASPSRQFAAPMRTFRVFERMLSNHEFVEKVGLSEEAVKNLENGFAKITEKEKDLQGKRGQLQKEQMERLAAVLASCPASTNGAPAKESNLGKLKEELETAFLKSEAIQHELNVLTVERIMLIRENMTDEQLSKASDYVRHRVNKQRRSWKEKKDSAGRKEALERNRQNQREKQRKRAKDGAAGND